MGNLTLHLAIELRDKLLAELQQNRLFRAYHHAEAAVAALNAEASGTQPPSQQEMAPETTGRQRQFSKPGTQTATILTAAEAYLREKGSRAPSGEILKVVTSQGIRVGGKNPGSTLASYLSYSALFDNDKNEGGYGLVEWSQLKTETPNSSELFGAPQTNGAEPLSP
jgi:hypothetical protein